MKKTAVGWAVLLACVAPAIIAGVVGGWAGLTVALYAYAGVFLIASFTFIAWCIGDEIEGTR